MYKDKTEQLAKVLNRINIVIAQCIAHFLLVLLISIGITICLLFHQFQVYVLWFPCLAYTLCLVVFDYVYLCSVMSGYVLY